MLLPYTRCKTDSCPPQLASLGIPSLDEAWSWGPTGEWGLALNIWGVEVG